MAARRRRIGARERRAWLVARHHLARTAVGVCEAVEAVVACHSSDPVTPYLAAWARVPGFAAADLEQALYEERTLWRLHAMRRTLFVAPVATAGVLHGAAGAEVARRERRKFEGWLAAEMDAAAVLGWLATVEARTLAVLADGREWRTQDLAAAVPELRTTVTVGSGRWTAPTPVSSRVLFLLALDGRVVRARPAGSWRSSQYRWAAAPAWFGEGTAFGGGTGEHDAPAARVDLARRYLAAHGPAPAADLRWWAGWSVRQTSAALGATGAVAVDLEGGGEGFVLPDDLDGDEAAAPDAHRVALLPGLDPTPMGWKERGWFLDGAHAGLLFDRNGNAGPTVWVDGRVAGGWSQRPDGEVVWQLLEDTGAEVERAVEAEAAALTTWLDGTVVSTRFRSPLERELAG